MYVYLGQSEVRQCDILSYCSGMINDVLLVVLPLFSSYDHIHAANKVFVAYLFCLGARDQMV